MSKVTVWAKLPVQPGKKDEAVALIQEALDAVESEPGTLLYILHGDPNDDNVLYFYDLYSDNDALASHGGSAWFKAYSAKLGAVLAGRPEIKILAPIGGKGL